MKRLCAYLLSAIACALVVAMVACVSDRSPSGVDAAVARSMLSEDWPNEPATFTAISDYAFNDSIPVTSVLSPDLAVGSGWRIINNNSGFVTKKTNETTVPFSPDSVGQWRYPLLFGDGAAPGELYRSLDQARDELFFGIWWKPSDPWDGHSSGINKIIHVLTNGSNHLIVTMAEVAPDTFRIIVTLSFPGICNQHLANSSGDACGARHLVGGTAVDVALGEWHQIEVYFKMSSADDAEDGIVKLWVDGTQVGNYTTANFDASDPFVELKISPTWGGSTGETKSEQDFFWYDHVRVSAP